MKSLQCFKTLTLVGNSLSMAFPQGTHLLRRTSQRKQEKGKVVCSGSLVIYFPNCSQSVIFQKPKSVHITPLFKTLSDF